MNLCELEPGCDYSHASNGSRYRCITSYPGYSALLERIPDKWTLLAHSTYVDEHGGICWSYSTGGHWPDGYPKFKKEGS